MYTLRYSCWTSICKANLATYGHFTWTCFRAQTWYSIWQPSPDHVWGIMVALVGYFYLIDVDPILFSLPLPLCKINLKHERSPNHVWVLRCRLANKIIFNLGDFQMWTSTWNGWSSSLFNTFRISKVKLFNFDYEFRDGTFMFF